MSSGRLRDLVDQVTTKAHGRKSAEFPYVGLENIEPGGRTLTGTAPSSVSESTNGVFENGDILFGKLRPNLRKAVQVDFGGYCSTDLLVLRPRTGVDVRYAGHVSASEPVFRHAERNSIGTGMPRTSWHAVCQAPAWVPPLEEQRRVAEILDMIDETIQATERVIAKLELTRLGLRERFCTYRGSGGNGTRLAKLVEAVVDCPHSTPEYRSFGVLVVRTMHIKDGRFLDRDASRVSEEIYRQRVARMVPSVGDVVLTREAPVGETFAIPEEMRICLGQRVVLIRPGRDLLGQYLVELIYSRQGRQQIRRLVAGTTNPHLNVNEIRDLVLDIPPLGVQRRAVRSLDAVSTQIEAETGKLEKLRWARTGLAADLLSGRVRTVAA